MHRSQQLLHRNLHRFYQLQLNTACTNNRNGHILTGLDIIGAAQVKL